MNSLRQAQGSDIWPVTWAADGNVYGAWGDGGGFSGNDTTGRVSLGFGRVSGTPADGNSSSYRGANVWGAAPQYAENQATFGGKVDQLISIGGVLYGEGLPWTTANCGCNPVLRSGAGPAVTMVSSADLGKTWQIAPWSVATPLGAFLQFGQDYQGAWDPDHVYLYYQGDVNADQTHVYLRRVLTSRITEDPSTSGHYEYFAGTDGTGAVLWTTTKANALAIFQDNNVPAGSYSVGGAIYDAPLGRYLLITFHGDYTGQIGLFEAPNPFGPWATVDYEDDWAGLNETAGPGNGMQFPTKWISGDGRTLWAVFSGIGAFDSFNVAALALGTSSSIPQISAPPLGSVLIPGTTITATGTGDTLSWSVGYVGGALIASGSGPSLNFVVPSDAQTYQLIRVTLTDSVGQVYRDFTVGNATISAAATPTITPPAGNYTSAQTVTISDSTLGATIYYTTDGSTPTANATLYTNPIAVNSNETINAIATAAGYTNSAVASAAYSISATAVATPTFSPDPGNYSTAELVTLSDTTQGATIYYSTDGSTPTTNSSVYSGPISVASTQTIEAIATAAGFANSAPASATYTISAPTAAGPTFSPAAGSYSSVQSVTISDTTAGATIYYTIDGSTPTSTSLLYAGPVTVGTTQTVKAIATATGYNQSTVSSATYVISITPAATPTFSPAAGTYSTAQTVTIADTTPGASIYYTTDGSTPTPASSVFSGPITVSKNQTLKAVAAAPGYNNSAVATAAYTISTPTAAAPSFSPAAGIYNGAQTVTITDATPGATIYYTLDGSVPTLGSATYSAAININATATLKAIAAASGYNTSSVASALYTINSGGTPLVNYSGGFASSAGLSLVKASVKSGALVLTDGNYSEARAAWYSTPVNVQSFSTSFTFQLSSGTNTADGFTFAIQNAPNGAATVGGLGGYLGYSGISASVAVKFDLYNNAGEGRNSTGFYTKGAKPEVPALDMTSSGVNLHSGDVFLVRLSYDGTTLRLNITDTKTSASFAASTPINIPALVGSKHAYIGFTGGTGGLSATQRILTWTYSAP